MLTCLLDKQTFLTDVECDTWQELVDIAAAPLIERGAIEPSYLGSIKETIDTYGSYMILVDDIAFFHGRPESGVNEISISLALLKRPVYLGDKRILAAFVFAAIDKTSHRDLLRELAWNLEDDDFLELLRNHGSRDDIMQKLRMTEEKHEIS